MIDIQTRVLAWAQRTNFNAPWKAGGVVAAIVGAGLIFFTADNAGGPNVCDTNPLQHVYSPQRLTVVKKCVTVDGTVFGAKREKDYDWHVAFLPDDRSLINAQNVSRQHGYLVVEFVPGDPTPKFRNGMRLRLHGTYVLDKHHGGWAEVHPVFSYEVLAPGGGPARTLAPIEG